MIYLKNLEGGLGNQMFKLAAAIGLAAKYNDKVHFPDWSYARYFQGNFESDIIVPEPEFEYTEPEFAYHEIPYKPNISLNGYFQSEKYFAHCRKTIRNMFTLKEVFTYNKILPNSCFIHVRRGDYKRLQQFHPLATWDNYYRRAVERMETFYPSRYYVFSDAPSEVMDEFPDNEMFEYIYGNDEITDLWLMTQCQYHIIGNSTYSWWAAYLCNQQNPQTIAPYKWFGEAYHFHNTKDLLPKEWMVM